MAGELEWLRPWDTVSEGEFPHFRFFTGGVSNPTINLLDRHLAQANRDAVGADNRLALVWEGEDFESRFFTYRMLAIEVNKFANVLKSFGVGKGDPVAIFTPNLAETAIAVLACFRIGAIYNTVFSGFSTRALRDRLDSYGPKVVVTANYGLRRGADPLKDKVDEAVEGLSSVVAVIVVERGKRQTAMRHGRDFWWHDLMLRASSECAAEPMEANEPGIVFYTSGTTGKPKGIVHSAMAFVVNNYV